MIDEQRIRKVFKNMKQYQAKSHTMNESQVCDIWFNNQLNHNIHISTDSTGELYIRSDDIKKLYKRR